MLLLLMLLLSGARKQCGVNFGGDQYILACVCGLKNTGEVAGQKWNRKRYFRRGSGFFLKKRQKKR